MLILKNQKIDFHQLLLVQSNSGNDPREVFLGHIGEMHYVSTCPILQDNETETCQSNSISRSEYMKNYRAKTKGAANRAKRNEYERKRRAEKNV